jgi:hypothetical protein
MAAASIIETQKLDLGHRVEVNNHVPDLVCKIKFRDVVTVVT